MHSATQPGPLRRASSIASPPAQGIIVVGFRNPWCLAGDPSVPVTGPSKPNIPWEACMARSVVRMVCLVTVVSGAVRAQQPARPDSTRPDSLRPRLLAPVIITGVLLPIRQDRFGFGSSLIGREQFESDPSAGASLKRTPGIWLDEGAGAGGPAVLRLRGGEEPYTQVLFDGVPININGGFLDVQGLALTNVERMEVARGPQSALYGSSAISGVVQMVTRRGESGPPRFDFSAEG